jgi:hypothetical protein
VKTNKLIRQTAVRIDSTILPIRGQKVIIDSDLAAAFGSTTKRLNEQVRRNQERFPEDFVFQLTHKEKDEVVANCVHLQKLKFSSTLPYACTEHGAIMAPNVLRSSRAAQMSIFVVRAFVRLREAARTYRELAIKIDELERELGKHDTDIHSIVNALRELMTPPAKPKRQIGFRVEEPSAAYSAKRKR